MPDGADWRDVFERGPDAVVTLVADARMTSRDLGSTFNWLLLGEQTYTRTIEEAHRAHRDEALAWGRAAQAVLGKLVSEDAKSPARLLHLRAALIEQFGAHDGENLLDPASLVAGFAELLPVTLSEAKCLTAHQLTVGESAWVARFRALRRVREMLGVIRRLVEGGVLVSGGELAEWLELSRHWRGMA